MIMKTVFIGEGGAQFTAALKKHGFSPIILPSDGKLPSFVSSHADMPDQFYAYHFSSLGVF